MPEIYFDVTWPSGRRQRCYSPSSVIEQHLTAGASYRVDEFVCLARDALSAASERVRLKYGFSCSAARDQLRHIETTAGALTASERAGLVRVEALVRSPAR